MAFLSSTALLSRTGLKVRFSLLCGFVLAAGAVLYLNNPAQSSLFPPCPFRMLTGLSCPGCGSLRGLHQLLHGNAWQAFNLNPLMVSCLPFLAYSFFSFMTLAFSQKPFVARPISSRHIWAFLTAVIVFGVLRNIPAYPLTFLSP